MIADFIRVYYPQQGTCIYKILNDNLATEDTLIL